MKTEKLLIVPDVHGRTFWKESVYNWDGNIVFLGDYLDPYPDEDISFNTALRGLKDIIELKEANPDRITLLLGNHDVHYIWEEAPVSTRFSRMFEDEVATLFNDYRPDFQVAKMIEQDGKFFLLTHAGLVKGWFDQNGLTVPEKTEVEDMLNKMAETSKGKAMLSQVGYSRWGDSPSGGPMWADFFEDHHLDYPIIPDVYQIVGHTGSVYRYDEQACIKKNIACIDRRKTYILEGGKLKDAIGEN